MPEFYKNRPNPWQSSAMLLSLPLSVLSTPYLCSNARILENAFLRSLILPLRHSSFRMVLRRTESFLSLPNYSNEESGSFPHLPPTSPSVPSNVRSVVYCKEHCKRFKLGGKSKPEFIIGSSPFSNTPSKQPKKQCTQTTSLSVPFATR